MELISFEETTERHPEVTTHGHTGENAGALTVSVFGKPFAVIDTSDYVLRWLSDEIAVDQDMRRELEGSLERFASCAVELREAAEIAGWGEQT